jgi:hypothetical protein
LACETRGDRRVPPLFAQAVRASPVVQGFCQPRPPARRIPLHNLRLAGSIGADVREAAAKDARQLQAQLAGELADLVLRLVDHVAADFGVLPFGEPLTDGPNPAADAVARVENRHVGAERGEIVRR